MGPQQVLRKLLPLLGKGSPVCARDCRGRAGLPSRACRVGSVCRSVLSQTLRASGQHASPGCLSPVRVMRQPGGRESSRSERRGSSWAAPPRVSTRTASPSASGPSVKCCRHVGDGCPPRNSVTGLLPAACCCLLGPSLCPEGGMHPSHRCCLATARPAAGRLSRGLVSQSWKVLRLSFYLVASQSPWLVCPGVSWVREDCL